MRAAVASDARSPHPRDPSDRTGLPPGCVRPPACTIARSSLAPVSVPMFLTGRADARAGRRRPAGGPGPGATHRPPAPAHGRAGAPSPGAASHRRVDRRADAQLRRLPCHDLPRLGPGGAYPGAGVWPRSTELRHRGGSSLRAPCGHEPHGRAVPRRLPVNGLTPVGRQGRATRHDGGTLPAWRHRRGVAAGLHQRRQRLHGAIHVVEGVARSWPGQGWG